MKKRLFAAAFVAGLGVIAALSTADVRAFDVNAAITHMMFPPGCSVDEGGTTVCRAGGSPPPVVLPPFLPPVPGPFGNALGGSGAVIQVVSA